MQTKRRVKILKSYRNPVDNKFVVVFNSSRLSVQRYNGNKTYPEDAFYMTMPGGMDFRYVFVPDPEDPEDSE